VSVNVIVGVRETVGVGVRDGVKVSVGVRVMVGVLVGVGVTGVIGGVTPWSTNRTASTPTNRSATVAVSSWVRLVSSINSSPEPVKLYFPT